MLCIFDERCIYMKYNCRCSLVLLCLLIISFPSLADSLWTNASPVNNRWDNSSNWNGGVPNITISAQLDLLTPNHCLIENGITADCKTLKIGNSLSAPGHLTMTGGTLNTNGFFKVGLVSDDSAGISTFTMSGGSVLIPGKFFTIAETGGSFGEVYLSGTASVSGISGYKVGNRNGGTGPAVGYMSITDNASFSCSNAQVGNNEEGDGTLVLTGGQFTVNGTLTVANSSTAIGHIQLDAGTIYCYDFSMAPSGGTASMDITEGQLVIDGDKRTTITNYKNLGLIKAYDGFGVVNIDFDGTNTIVTSQSQSVAPAWGPQPQSGLSDTAPDTLLYWNPGNGADNHDIYFGTSETAVTDANLANPMGVYEARQTVGNEMFDPGLLATGQTYYWRIDESSGEDLTKGPIWYFTTGDGKASNPIPADEDAFIDPSIILQWQSGIATGTYDVYIGTDYTAVASADTADPEFMDSVSVTQYDPASLELGQTHYWRVDERTGGEIYYGDVWSFSVVEASDLEVDDFDEYSSTADLLNKWNDGSANATGSSVSLELNEYLYAYDWQGMRMDFDNTSSATGYISEADFEINPAMNWNSLGVMSLSLWYRGHENVDRLYFRVSDGSNEAVKVLTPADNINTKWWKEINIPLSDFASIDLSAVTKLTIGVGKQTPEPGAAGTVYIDEIWLYPSRCTDLAMPPGDMTGDCKINIFDFLLLGENWLKTGYYLTASAPGTGDLVAYYPLDETSGTTAHDQSGNGNNATVDLAGSGNWTTGYINGCMNFDGSFGMTVPSGVFTSMTDQFTVSMWVKGDITDAQSRPGTVQFGAGHIPASADDNDWNWSAAFYNADELSEYAGQWNHFAFVYDGRDSTIELYRNGLLVSINDAQYVDFSQSGVTMIGRSIDGGDNFVGDIDEVRIYSTALTHEEILYLAGGTNATQQLAPVLAPAESSGDNMLNYEDFADTARNWMSEVLWP